MPPSIPSSSSSRPLSDIRIRGQRKRRVAEALLNFHRKTQNASAKAQTAPLPPVQVVCVSDTHNRQPDLPPGDVLIHAGDLTESGSFDEMQAGLSWLSSQPHKHKIHVAGNHDVLLDESFLARHPERRYGQSKTKAHLDWGDVVYLQDSSVTLEVTIGEEDNALSGGRRSLTIFGSPWTPRYGVSAFQYQPGNPDYWDDKTEAVGRSPDILRDFHRAGCPYLAEWVHRLRPRLMVFGHIHAAYGREDVVLDDVQRAYGEVMTGWAGWGALAWMAVSVAVGGIGGFLGNYLPRDSRVTTFVNAAVVAGPQNELRYPPIVVEI